MRARIVDESDVDEVLDGAIKRTLGVCFPHNKEKFSRARRWRGNTPVYNAVVCDEDTVLGNISVVDRTIDVGGELLRVAGIANVSVLPGHRGRGISDIMLKAVMEEAVKRDFEVGFLFTIEGIKKIYGRNGWIEIEDCTVVRVENGEEIIMPKESVKMYYPLKRKDFPPGDVHLRGDKW